MRRILLLSLWIGGLAAGAASAQDMAAFPVQWAKDPQSPADVSFLLRAPAGKAGFVRIVGGHLAGGDGARLRFWGINATGRGGLPDKANAPVIAANLARVGINCVRFHFLDRPAPAGIIDAKRDDTRALDPAQLDRLDFFIAELAKRGIYSDLNLNVARGYKKGDGVRDYEYLGFAKALTCFDPRIIELQKEYARQLLTHRNAYTGNEYRNEPAVAIVELLNENSLIERWFEGGLQGKNTTKNPGTWTDITASYADALTEKYNAWLKQRLTAQQLAALRTSAGMAADQPIPRLIPKEFAKADKLRFDTEAEFYLSVERDFITDMGRFLRQDLGVKQLLIANSDHAHHKSGYGQLSGTSLLDVVDGHVYWQHPRYIAGEGGRRGGFEITNTPMVDDPAHSSVVQLARSAFAGKPYTVSEVNHPFPAEYACEGVPILAAYAAFQDWDGIFWYTLAHDDVGAMRPVIRGHFDFAFDPVKMAQLPVGALMFLRGDVRSASQTKGRSYSRQQVIDSIRLPYAYSPLFTPGFPGQLALRHAIRIDTLDAATSPKATVPWDPPDVLTCDTGELTWSAGQKRTGLVKIDTPRTQALIGFCRARGEKTTNLAVDVANEFCAITLSSLDDRPIASSSRLLLTATARVGNTGMTWNDKRTTLPSWGAAPTRIEAVSGKIALRALAPAKSIAARVLDGAGRPLDAPIQSTNLGDVCTLPIGATPTTGYIINVQR